MTALSGSSLVIYLDPLCAICYVLMLVIGCHRSLDFFRLPFFSFWPGGRWLEFMSFDGGVRRKGEEMKKGIWISFFLVLSCFLLVNVSSGLAEEKVIINGIDANFPPFAYVDKFYSGFLQLLFTTGDLDFLLLPGL